MATQVAPGYNPDVSLLQGGTAPIVPMRGGSGNHIPTAHQGGANGAPPTPDYNSTASLLQGGTGVIEAVKGGAKVTFAPNLVKERTYQVNAPPQNIVRASKSYTLEIYGIQTKPSELTLDSDLNVRQRRLLRYVNQEKNVRLLTSIGAIGQADGQFVYSGYPKYGDCKPALPINFFDVMAKKVQFLDNKAHTIWVVPNVRGNKEVFETIYDKIIDDNGLLPGKDHVLIFTGAFYADTPNETSVFLFDQIMKLKEKNPNQVFVLSTPDNTLLRNGCFILENTYAMRTTLAKQQGKSKEIPTFFEPNVLVFPYEKLLLRSGSLPISTDSKVSVGLLLRKKVTSKSFYIKGEPGRKTEPAPFENFTTILCDTRQPETKSWPPKSQQTIRCPAGSDCQDFEVGFPLEKLGDSIVLNLLETKLFLLHITLEKIPYFTTTKVGEEEEEEEEEEEAQQEEEEEEEGEEEEEEEPEVIPDEEIQIEAPKIPKGYYKGHPNAVQSNRTVQFKLEGFTFTVRVPSSTARTDPVRLDWLNQRFSTSEAELLNALQLNPSLLKKAFGLNYKYRVSLFLASLAVSSCFKEHRLLLKSECDDARRFLRSVAFELQRLCLTKATKEWESIAQTQVTVVEPKNENEPNEEQTFPPNNNNNDEEEEEEEPPMNEDESELESNSNLIYPINNSTNTILENMRGLRLEEEPKSVVLVVNTPQEILGGLQGLTLDDTTPISTIQSGLQSLVLDEGYQVPIGIGTKQISKPVTKPVTNPVTKPIPLPPAKADDVAGIYLVWNDNVLVHRRSDALGGTIGANGGSVDPNENFEQAALRELKEEAQVKVNGQTIPYNKLENFYNVKDVFSKKINKKINFSFFVVRLAPTDTITVNGPENSSFAGEVQTWDAIANQLGGKPAYTRGNPIPKMYYYWVNRKTLQNWLQQPQNRQYSNLNFLNTLKELNKYLG